MSENFTFETAEQFIEDNIEYVEIEGLQTSISIESLDDWFENTNSNIDEISKKINDLTKQKMYKY